MSNKDVFKQADEIDKKVQDMPTISAGIENTTRGKDLSEYTCRVYRGNIGGDSLEDQAMIESILTRGLSGSDDVVIIDRDKQSFEDNYWIIITYLEKRAR